MIPLRDVIPSRTTPYVTIGLIILNVLAFLYEVSLPESALEGLVRVYGVVPAELSWPALVASMFLHGGWLHIAGNMLCLWLFGDNVEDRLGHGRFLIFYLLCGVAAAMTHVALNTLSVTPTIGASGAISGVMGAYFVLYPHSRILTLVPIFFVVDLIEVPAVFFLGLWFLLQLFYGLGQITMAPYDAGGIAFWAHTAGFATGAGGVFAFRRPERQHVEWWS